MSSSPIVHLVLARLRASYREPETIFWTFLFPPLLAVALGVAFRAEGPTASDVAVIAGPGARDAALALRADPSLDVAVLDGTEAERRLRAGRVAIVVAPLAAEGGPLAVYRYDPTRPDARVARAAVDAALQRAAGRTDPLAVRDDLADRPGARYIDFLVPGLLGLTLMGGGLWGIGWTIVEARTRRFLRRLLVTPMRRRDFVLAQILSRLVFVPLEAVILLGLAALLFDVGIAGSLPALAAVIAAGALAFAGLGTLVASRARTLETISGLINLCTLPMFVLSGVFFSSDRFPDALQPIIRALPLTALNEALRAVINEGAPLLALGPRLLVLGLWGGLGFALAVRLFRWTV